MIVCCKCQKPVEPDESAGIELVTGDDRYPDEKRGVTLRVGHTECLAYSEGYWVQFDRLTDVRSTYPGDDSLEDWIWQLREKLWWAQILEDMFMVAFYNIVGGQLIKVGPRRKLTR